MFLLSLWVSLSVPGSASAQNNSLPGEAADGGGAEVQDIPEGDKDSEQEGEPAEEAPSLDGRDSPEEETILSPKEKRKREQMARSLDWADELLHISIQAGEREQHIAAEHPGGEEHLGMGGFKGHVFKNQYWTPGALPVSSSRFPKSSLYYDLGAYDLGTIRPVFAVRRWLPEFEPQGKTVCEIHYATRDVFVPSEPFPLWANKLHVTTRESTLATSFQYNRGELYNELRLQEAVREQEDGAVFSTVVAVPVASEEPGCVEVAVIARDIWSLRAGWDLHLSGGVLQELSLQLVETNLAGLNDTLGLSFMLDQGSWELGALWEADWIKQNDLYVLLELRAIFDRELGGIDGSAGHFVMKKPIRTVRDRSGWIFESTHRVATERVYEGEQIRTERLEDPESGEMVNVPRRWYESDVEVQLARSWAFGDRNRHILFAGGFLDIVETTPRPYDPTLSPEVLQLFERNYLPREERGLGPLLRYRFYQQKFIELTNYREFERTERYRGGFEALAEARYSEEFVGADSRFLEGVAAAAYRTNYATDGMLELGVLQSVRLQGHISDIRTEGVLRLATPSGVAGRFVNRLFVRRWARNEENDFFKVGANNAVRGVGSSVLEGSNALIQNLEWRSRAINLWSIRLGVAFFSDLGATWEPGERLDWKSSVGFGFRLFAPQLMSTVVSLDIGFEVGKGHRWQVGTWNLPVDNPEISIRFGQLFEGASKLTERTLAY